MVKAPGARPEMPTAPPVETMPTPDTSRERVPDVRVETAPQPERSPATEQVQQAAPAQAPVAPAPAPIDPQLKAIEEVLSEDLGELYQQLPPNVKPAFRAKGEEVARTIREWASEAKLKAGKVLRLIRDWLGMIPNVNKFYLAQESKIKTDQIMSLAQELGEEQETSLL